MREPRKLKPRGSRAGILLLALLLFRAYVPAGFMPAKGAPFALELCPAVSVGMHAHLHHHSGTHADFEACPFGSAPGAGPISHHVGFAAAAPAALDRTPRLETTPPTQRAQRTHQPRGPPSLA